MTKEIAAESGLEIDISGFNSLMAQPRNRERVMPAPLWEILDGTTGTAEVLGDIEKTEFVGYNQTCAECKVISIIGCETSEQLDSASDGDVIIILDRTPFYGEGGGQVGDTGEIICGGRKITVNDTKKNTGIYLHFCTLDGTLVSVGDTVTAQIDTDRRDAIRRNHSACRLSFKLPCVKCSEVMLNRRDHMLTRIVFVLTLSIFLR